MNHILMRLTPIANPLTQCVKNICAKNVCAKTVAICAPQYFSKLNISKLNISKFNVSKINSSKINAFLALWPLTTLVYSTLSTGAAIAQELVGHTPAPAQATSSTSHALDPLPLTAELRRLTVTGQAQIGNSYNRSELLVELTAYDATAAKVLVKLHSEIDAVRKLTEGITPAQLSNSNTTTSTNSKISVTLKNETLNVNTRNRKSQDKQNIQARCLLAITSTSTQETAALLDALGQLTALRIVRLSFSPDPLGTDRKEAIALALQDSRSKALLAAQTMGVKVGKVLDINITEEIAPKVYQPLVSQDSADDEQSPNTSNSIASDIYQENTAKINYPANSVFTTVVFALEDLN